MRKLLIALATTFAVAGCGSAPAAPEGFTIALRFMSIDVNVVERVTINFRPQDGGTFRSGPDQTLEDGVTLHVEDDGTLTMDVSGIYLRSHLVDVPMSTEPIAELHVWSDDPRMRTGPLMVAYAYRSGGVIGGAMQYLPAWPPPIVEDGGCSGSLCRTQLVITCDAAAVDRCR